MSEKGKHQQRVDQVRVELRTYPGIQPRMERQMLIQKSAVSTGV